MKKEHMMLGKFAVVMFVFYMGTAFIYCLMLPYLKARGLGTVAQGWIFAFGAILTIAAQFVTGYLCDRYRTDKKVFIVILILLAAVTWLLYSSSGEPMILIVLWAASVSALSVATGGILDSWTIESDEYCLTKYGWIRAFGAIGFTIGAPLTTYCFERWGYASIGYAFLGFAIITLVLSLFVSDAVKVKSENKIKLTDMKVLVKNSNFVIVTIILLFLNMAMTADGYSTVYKIMNLGLSFGLSEEITNAQINFKWAFQALCELPLFFLGDILVRRIGGTKVLLLSTCALVIRFILYAMAVEPMQLVWISVLQAVTFPLITICSKLLIDEASPLHLRATGQQLSSAVYLGFSALVTPVICGVLAEVTSDNFALLTIAGICVIPVVLLIMHNHRQKPADTV